MYKFSRSSYLIVATIITCVFLATFSRASSESKQSSLAANGIPAEKNMAVSVELLSNRVEAAFLSGTVNFAEPLTESRIIGSFGKGRNRNPKSNLVGAFDLNPFLDLQIGENGTFQAIVGKLTGDVMFSNVKLGLADGDGELGPLPPIHVFPISLGFETTRFLDSSSVLAEVGYTPFVHLGAIGSRNAILGTNPQLGVFLQGGYKFDTGSATTKGASQDQSSESTGDYIMRAKADFQLALDDIVAFSLLRTEFSMDLMTWATGWYDIAHDDLYHSVGVRLRFDLPAQDGKHFDLTFENGSGEPNFNKGSQFGAALTITF